ncbi:MULTISPECIES: HEAT repeat domain-containing protein [Pontibacillus]|uniref:HEAT repeat domain-containing protein n=1 Tax=Pontibacillus chungwhensis TaxID=265426 RepID=A0ABY8V184_9BACI|nr:MULTISPECIES: hypothetical protein [Pontibacillus]MCD5324308.1 hypothetical protein [Pontibacillus sp. HN14]WIF99395.1 hypothetical protein QNI29_06980 [Pontibacillus chungwhensis]
MFFSLDAAFYVIYVLAGLMAIMSSIIIGIKVRKKQLHKKTQKVMQRYQSYFTYLTQQLDAKEPLEVPKSELTTFEKKVFQRELVERLERLSGNQRDKLIQLCNDLGLKEFNMKRLKSGRHYVRLEAAYNLGAMRAKEAVPSLCKMLYKNKKDSTRFIVARSIAQTATSTGQINDMIHYLAKDQENNYQLIVDIAQESDLDLSGAFISLLKESNPELTKVGLFGLRHQPDSEIHSILRPHLDSKDFDIRTNTAKLMVASGQCSQKEMEQFMKFKDEEVRLYTGEWIGQAGMRQYQEVLELGVQDKNQQVARTSAKSLSQLGESGFRTLCKLAVSNLSNGTVAFEAVHEHLKESAAGYATNRKIADYNQKLSIYETYFGKDQQLIDAM